MILLRALILLGASLSLAGAAETTHSGKPSKPNIVLILADDMGWSDLSCYGSEIPTPNLDQLAKEGLSFTQFYNAGRCCPSRAALLTGLYPHETGVGHMMKNEGFPGYLGHLNEHCVTLAEVLGKAGYFTAMTGKWHLGQTQGTFPWTRGFQRSLEAPIGNYYFDDGQPQTQLFLNGKLIPGNDPQLPKHWYSTDLWTEFGIKFIDEARTQKQPFFLYLAYNAPHYPLQAPPEDIAKFRGQYRAGWDVLRAARFERMKKLGLIDAATELSPRPPEVQAWEKLSGQQQDRFDEIMAIYAACVWHMDKAIGDLIAALKERGELDNTLIFFLSDNGGNSETGPDGRAEGKTLGAAESIVYCGQSWATLQNTPFRLYKRFIHEGGIATPLIVHWPAGIKSAGELRRQPGSIVDMMNTLVDIGGAAYPKTFNGAEIRPSEGQSLRPEFDGQSVAESPIYWEHQGNAGVRDGDWKLVRKGAKGAWELYNLKIDRTELHDVARSATAPFAKLLAEWHAWTKRAQVIPGPANFTGNGDAENTPPPKATPALK